MKTELKAKFLQHLTNKRKDEGFTPIELPVVIIIIGILSAIALPSFLNQASKARQSEARTNIGALNRTQQSYYLENQAFTNNITSLGIGIKNSDNYNFSATGADVTNAVGNLAESKKPDLKAYTDGVFRADAQNTVSVLCEANNAAATTPNAPTLNTANSAGSCPGNYTALK
ncbi:MAG: prepilin-type N-terminal cleavage/methylation domain-containing protein [Gloeocapsa sp. UFS-A4-WI-NPMV-4B04]|jgi:prepilin-type N-terminal cleavage/methylation domain-containing protein|nr:prepilin-type N-terminal cleavage/methylation domain-containing protein [Gloeocapsa sp. UFS-A4-WI-NPMV-4B04]